MATPDPPQKRLLPLGAGLAAAAIACFVAARVFAFESYDLFTWYQLARHGAVTQTTAIHPYPWLSRGCHFDYDVGDSHPYNQVEIGCNDKIGKTAVVTYLPGEPDVATVKSPGVVLAFRLGVIALVSAFAGLAAARRMARRGYLLFSHKLLAPRLSSIALFSAIAVFVIGPLCFWLSGPYAVAWFVVWPALIVLFLLAALLTLVRDRQHWRVLTLALPLALCWPVGATVFLYAAAKDCQDKHLLDQQHPLRHHIPRRCLFNI